MDGCEQNYCAESQLSNDFRFVERRHTRRTNEIKPVTL